MQAMGGLSTFPAGRTRVDKTAQSFSSPGSAMLPEAPRRASEPTLNGGAETNQKTNNKPTTAAAATVMSRNSITVNRTVKVEPLGTLSASRPTPSKYADQGPVLPPPNIPTGRACQSAGILRKPLPMIPSCSKIDEKGVNLKDVPGPRAPVAGNRRPDCDQQPTKLPPFRQSKGWARMYDPPRTEVDLTITHEPRPRSAREKSMDQQRAQLRSESIPGLPAPKLPETPIEPSSVQDEQSIIVSDHFCKPLLLPAWHNVRATRVPQPRNFSNKWASRVLSLRRKGTATHRRSESLRTAARESSTRQAQIKRRLRPKGAVTDLRYRAKGSDTIAVSDEPETVIDLNDIERKPARETRSDSLRASLHDIEYIRTWSAECQALLQNGVEAIENPDFQNKWTVSPDHGLISEHVTAKATDHPTVPGALVGGSAGQSKTDYQQNSTTVAPDVATSAASAGSTSNTATVPLHPPRRKSSMSGPRPVLHLDQSSQTPTKGLVGDARDKAPAGRIDVKEKASKAAFEPKTPTKNLRQRKAPNSSARSTKGPKHAASTDTLANIEAEALNSPSSTTIEYFKQNTGLLPPQERKVRCAPSGLPPRDPLPALPHDSERTADSEDSGCEKRRLTYDLFSVGEGPDSPNMPIVPDFDEPRENGRISRMCSRHHNQTVALKIPSSRSSDTEVPAVIDGLCQQNPAHDQGTSEATKLSSPSSRSYLRHDVSSLRPNRCRNVKKRYRDERDRERRISEEDESSAGSKVAAKVLAEQSPRLNKHISIDEIDKFPAVPNSRPQSRASTRRPQSSGLCQRSQSSRASSSYRMARPATQRPILGKSDIRILVDTDPSTGSWRAGALSPEPGVGSSFDGSPSRSDRVSRQDSLRDLTNLLGLVSKKSSSKSIKIQDTSRLHTPFAVTHRIGSEEMAVDSGDEIAPLLANPESKPASASARRQDRLEKTRSQRIDELEQHVLELERTSDLQRRDVLRMMRSMSKFHFHTATRDRSAGYDDDEEEEENLSPRQKHATGKSAATKRTKIGTRPCSGGSSTSAASHDTCGSTAQTSAISGDASLTDPQEYDDVHDARPGTAKSNKSAVVALHKPPPVATVVPKGRLPEEGSSVGGSRGGSEDLGVNGNVDEDVSLDINRPLSFNCGMITTDMMDEKLERFNRTLLW